MLRGLGILAVILLHLNMHLRYYGTFPKDVLPEQVFTLVFRSGFNGEMAFFTLSG